MRLSRIARWCRAVEGPEDSYEGKLVLSSLVHDLDEKHVSRRLLRVLLRRIRSLFPKWSDHGTAAVYVITEIADTAPTQFFCRGMRGPSRDARCSRVMIDRDFFNHNIDNAKIGRPITGAAISDAHLQMVIADPPRYAANDFPPLTMKRPFVWVTDTEELRKVVEEEVQNNRRPADRVRNGLGLAHFMASGEPRLIEIEYPARFFRKHRRVPLAAPTFLEGRPPNMVYRSLRNADGWGMTVDLSTGQPGLPEAVHGRVPFKGDFKIRNLGRFVAVTARYSYEQMYNDAPTKWASSRARELQDILDG